MCDYSLHDVKTRPAKVGDKLTTAFLLSAHEASLHRKIKASRFAYFLARSFPSQMKLGACAFGLGRPTLPMHGLQSSGRSIKTAQRAITMRWNFQMAGQCC